MVYKIVFELTDQETNDLLTFLLAYNLSNHPKTLNDAVWKAILGLMEVL